MSFNLPAKPVCYSLTISATSLYAANAVHFSGVATFTQLANTGSADVTIRLNADDNAVFTLPAQTVQCFNANSLDLTSVEVAGGSADTTVDIIAGVVQA